MGREAPTQKSAVHTVAVVVGVVVAKQVEWSEVEDSDVCTDYTGLRNRTQKRVNETRGW